MDWATAIVWIVIIVLGTIVVQYLFNPYFHRFGLPKRGEELEENSEEKSEEERKKEEEFYRQIWTAKKRKS